jgi:hypothetical protein
MIKKFLWLRWDNEKKPKTSKNPRPKRIILTREEILKRMREFPLRKDAFIAAIRKVKD